MTVISYTSNKSNILYLSMYFDLTGHVSLPNDLRYIYGICHDEKSI